MHAAIRSTSSDELWRHVPAAARTHASFAGSSASKCKANMCMYEKSSPVLVLVPVSLAEDLHEHELQGRVRLAAQEYARRGHARAARPTSSSTYCAMPPTKYPTSITEQEQSAPGRYQDLHCIKSDYINPNINVKLYDYIKPQASFLSSSTSPRSKSTWSFTAADKNPAAAMIFDRRRRLRQDPPPP
jgi:hypothetical protein